MSAWGKRGQYSIAKKKRTRDKSIYEIEDQQDQRSEMLRTNKGQQRTVVKA